MTSPKTDDIEISTLPNGRAEPAVLVRDAYKSYTASTKVLRGLNLTVPLGAIYGLLGPSGCGKTTLLNCIAGRMTLDSGTVQLKISRRSELGYMPQDLSLHNGMSIMENFYFYGYIFGLEDHVIQTRAEELMSFLDLPMGHRLLSELSGGQQRRISLAVTIFHDPKLMILDEPTVGLDPILSQSIWEYLLKMAANGKTIIITTHYIQEARQAHMIGLLRNGKLLAEEPPLKLMEKCSCDNLEEAFLKLSITQEDHDDKEVVPEPKKTLQPKLLEFEEDNRIFSRKKFGAVMFKNWTLFKREYTILILVIMLPFLQSSFFCLTTGRTPKHLQVAVINEEISLAECKYKNFSTGCFINDVDNVPLSCLYLKYLAERTYEIGIPLYVTKTFLAGGHLKLTNRWLSYYHISNFPPIMFHKSAHQRDFDVMWECPICRKWEVEYDNESLALDHVNTNKVWGLLHFPRNYTESFARRFLDGTAVKNEFVTGSFLDIWMDFSNRIVGSLMKQEFVQAMQSFLRTAMENCQQNPRVISYPLVMKKIPNSLRVLYTRRYIQYIYVPTLIELQKPVFGSFGEEFISYSANPLICILCFFLPSVSTALRLYMEKSEGILERMIINGVSIKEMLISISVIQLGIHLVQYAIIMFIILITTDLVVQGSFLTLSILMLLVGISGMLFGFVLAIGFNDLMLIAYSGMGTTFILAFLSGLLSSTETAHSIIRFIRRFMPVCLEVDSARSITVRGFPFTHPQVYSGFIASIVWIMIFSFLLYLSTRSKKSSLVPQK